MLPFRCLTGSHNCHEDAVCTYATGSRTPQCTCRRGFVGDGFNCQDLDECITYRHDCSFDEMCVNTEGGFYCKKRETSDGSRLTLPGQACFDGSNTCHNLATCVPDNNHLGYDCICHEGFHGNGGGMGPGAPGCNDIDECATINECNSLGSTCINTFGNYICKKNQDPSGVCDNSDCDALAMCVPNAKSSKGYDCVCKDGFKGNGNARMVNFVALSGSSKGCKDIDECATGDHHCTGQTCVNTPGSFFCTITLDPWAVCAEGAHKCHEHAICMPSNAPRAYDCVCKAGYTGNGNLEADFWSDQRGGPRGCVDVDECRGKKNNCIKGAQQCVNVEPEQGGFVCVDLIEPINDCADLGFNATEQCGDDGSSYDCKTYEEADEDGNLVRKFACVDVDECSVGTDTCTENQSCKNVVGSFECLGLKDINDACAQNPCDEGLICANMGDGSYQCLEPDLNVVDKCSEFESETTCKEDRGDEFICMLINDEPACVNTTISGGDPYGLCETFYCGENMACSVDGEDFQTRVCSCVDGFDLVGDSCVDVDECVATHDCEEPSPHCKNTVGSFLCLTDDGLSDWWCNLRPGICGSFDANANCTATENGGSPSFSCSCSDGYENTDPSADPTIDPHLAQCRDRIDCFDGSDFCNGDFCIEQVGVDAICTNATDPLNLCTGNSPCGAHGTCSLSANKKERVCTCHSGFELVPVVEGSNALICADIDECVLDANLGDNVCSVLEVCINTPGSYRCEATPDPLGLCVGANSPCFGVTGAKCVVSADKMSATCACKSGYFYGPDEDGVDACNEIDECIAGFHSCTASQACANVPGGYFCVDNDGPCAAGAHSCHQNARCIPSYAKRGYDCECLTGFNGQGEAPKNRTLESAGIVAMGPNGPRGCIDNDECESHAHDCHPDETCQNTVGSYTCSLEYDPFNVCAEGVHDCHELAACTPIFPNGQPEHKCTCRAGYQGSGQVCVNQNECALDMDDCSAHQFCIDLEGSYQCYGSEDPLGACDSNDCDELSSCKANPNMEDGYECKDINECLSGSHTCTESQTCINTDYGAGYVCIGRPDETQVCNQNGPADRDCASRGAKCEVANTVSGYKCVDINECEEDEDICSDNGTNRNKCVNKNPGYACVNAADDEFLQCMMVDCGPNADCAVSAGKVVCTCLDGYAPGLDDNICVDIDECADGSHECFVGVCVNTDKGLTGQYYICDDGSDPFGVCAGGCDNSTSTGCDAVGEEKNTKQCMCANGFENLNDNGVVDLSVCVDIDECARGTNNCGPNVCVNTQGSFTCDIGNLDVNDICSSDDSVGKSSCRANGDAAAECNLISGDITKFTCACSDGFANQLVGGLSYETCVDIDECAQDPAVCTDDQTCINSQGSFSCANNDEDPFNVCAEGAHRCGSGADFCIADGETYECSCKDGFRPMISVPHTQCVDIDECEEADHNCEADAGQICINKSGFQTVDILGETDQDASTTTGLQGFECKWKSLVDPHGVCNGPDALVCFGPTSFCEVWDQDKTVATCECPSGFYYDQTKGCVDLNECKWTALNTCTFSEICVNTVGSYQCVENKDPFGHCSSGNCHPKAVCTPGQTEDDFLCDCADGYEGDGFLKTPRFSLVAEGYGQKEKGEGKKKKKKKGCVDINECQRGMDHCHSIGKFCVNTDGSYHCVDDAAVDHPCGSGAHDCHHLARCEVSPQSKSGYICKCNHGFSGNGRESKRALTGEIVANGSPSGCADINECKFGHHNCALGQFCHNTIGGFKCIGVAQSPTPCEAISGTPQDCAVGMKCVHTENGSPKCIDKDECVEQADPCPYGKSCVNTIGSFSCIAGAAASDPCESNPCSNEPGTACVSHGNTFACVDENECVTGHDCRHGEICYNTDGGYVCVPDPLSVCAAGAHNCHANAACIPNDSNKKGFDCVCDSGYYGQGNKGNARMSIDDFIRSIGGPKGCEDIDECANTSANDCEEPRVCVNTPGSYFCAAFTEQDKGDELCEEGQHQCSVTENCIVDDSAKNGRRCVCKDGFDRVNGKCKDTNECEAGLHNCSPLQVCWNEVGSFTCLGDADPLGACDDVDCGSGFECVAFYNRQGFKCIDINECDNDDNNDCTDDQTCINFAGSFACKLSSGPEDTTADPCDEHRCAPGSRCEVIDVVATCVLINECVELVQPCPWGEICVDQADGFMCKKDNGHVCNKKKKNECSAHSTCMPLDKTNYECICDAGYKGDRAQGCTDINECLNPLACADGEYCINTAGSFVCFPDEVVQTDVETPCDDNDCDINAHCEVNYHAENGYECHCNNGFRGDGIAKFSYRTLIANGQQKGCKNIDECKEGTHTCGASQGCTDTEGGFDCRDDPHGVCQEGAHQCNEGSVCSPKPGQLWDYECSCRAGFEDSCMAECGTTWSFCYKNCLNRVGKGNFCVDVDECALALDDCHTIDVSAGQTHSDTDHIVSEVGEQETTCVNQPGDYYCTTLKDPLGLCESWENNNCNNVTTTCVINEDDRLTYTCEPNPGYMLNDDGEVVDIDECSDFTLDNCENIPGIYGCPVTNEAMPGACVDKDGVPNGLWCVNTEGSFECVAPAEDPYNICADNPCGINPANGTAFPCTPRTSDAHQPDCNCFPEENEVGAIRYAEFDADAGTCVDYANCDPTDGSFIETGEAGQGTPCEAGEFCVEGDFEMHQCTNSSDPYNVCVDVDCGFGACVPVQSAMTDYKCVCDEGGFFQTPLDEQPGNQFFHGSKGVCRDVDECGVMRANCPAEADFCVNTIGSYECTALDDPFEVCTDINTCGPNGECTLSNDRREAICGCRSGFKDICEEACETSSAQNCYELCISSLVTEQRCQNINECDRKNPTHNCLATEECFDIEGGFLCRNQCELSDPCDPNASCTADYSKAGFTCACNAGYHGNGMAAKSKPDKDKDGNKDKGGDKYSGGDGDEEEEELVGYGQKVNKEASGCVDIDECELRIHNCDASKGEICINGLFNETTGLGYECNSEADPEGVCAFNAHDCHPLASCIVDHMAEDGYVCECNAGYYGNGKFFFIDVNGRKRRSDDIPYGADEKWTPDPYDPSQRAGVSNVKGCLDIDECHYDIHDCISDDACYNSVGSFYCFEDEVPTVPPVTVVDSVDCFMSGLECDANVGICILDPLNTQFNGYNCKCPDGYEGDGLSCSDIDECKQGTHSCAPWNDEYCKNTEGGFECQVNTECDASPCHPAATCSPVDLNKFECSCPEGYKGNGKGDKGCEDINECNGGHKCHSSAMCNNVPGSYECRCPDDSLINPLIPCASKYLANQQAAFLKHI